MSNNFTIKEFDPFIASEETYKEITKLLHALRREVEPIDPLTPMEQIIRGFKQKHPHYDWKHWLIYDEKKIIAYANIIYPKKGTEIYEQNKSIAYPRIQIHKTYRRKGLGTRMMKIFLEELSTNHNEVTTLEREADSESGKKFSEKLQGTIVLSNIESRCNLENIDWKLMEEWRKAGRELTKTSGVKLLTYEKVPDVQLSNFCNLWSELDNQQPLGEIDSKDVCTPKIRREQEDHNKGLGYRRLTIIAQEKDGILSGLTEVQTHKTNPYRITQELTGVKEQYRNRGLGKWLKAEMVYQIRDKYPEAKYILTGNAAINKAMLSINNRMGFKEHKKSNQYKFTVKKLKKVLENLTTN